MFYSVQMFFVAEVRRDPVQFDDVVFFLEGRILPSLQVAEWVQGIGRVQFYDIGLITRLIGNSMR